MGTSTTRVVVGEFIKGEKNPKIIGVGESETKGVRHGYIVNCSDAISSLKKAVALAEKTSGIKAKRAFISVGGTTLRSEISSGTAIISKADGEVTNLDITKVLEDSENNLTLGNKKVIQIFPLSYKLDGKEIQGRVEGMRGTKLEARALFVTCSSQHLEDLLTVVAECGIEPLDIIPSPIAGSLLALSKKQKIVGSGLVDIGSETTSIAIFENESLISLETFPIGSSDITNDIALGLKIPLEKAESMKLGTLLENIPKKKLDEIIDARLSDIFELIEKHLKKIKRDGLLPAGIIFIGGGANIPKLEELSKSILRLPSTVGTTDIFGSAKTKLRDTSWFTAIGLLSYKKTNIGYTEGTFPNLFKDLKHSIKSFVKQLMP